MTALLVVPMSLALAATAPGLGWWAHAILAALLLLMLGTGQLVLRLLSCPANPFLALVAGFVLLANGLLAADALVPGVHWTVAAAFVIPAAAGFYGGPRTDLRTMVGVALCIGLFTFAWNIDLAPRLATFRATGRLAFWADILVHAGNLAEFAAPDAIGRGMVLMADATRPLYHYASYLPAALLTRLAGTPPLEAVILAWIPLGILVMASGVAGLGLALGGRGLAVLSLAALAVLPAPERLTLDNGWFGFAWLLETGPSTPYSLGVACAALAAVVQWHRSRSYRSLALAIALCAGCILVRANTFIWLAPVVVLGAMLCSAWLKLRTRLALLALGFVALVAFLAALSWPALVASPRDFLFGYVQFAFVSNDPTRIDGLYPVLMQHVGRIGAGISGVGLILVGTLGPWLPLFLVLGVIAWRHRLLTLADTLPLLLVLVAMLMTVMAPQARNGDISEYRHRAGPLLVVVLAVWTLRFALILMAAPLLRIPTQLRRSALAGVAVVSTCILALTIGSAKRPRMAWGGLVYDMQLAPDLLAVAPALTWGSSPDRRFAVAGQPLDSRLIDDAARLVALSGVPAYVSCPGFMIATDGALGVEARRRVAVVTALGHASSLASLRAAMQAAGITHYVAITPQDAAFDPERAGAMLHSGSMAVYAAAP